jgi:hypothetical protein
VEAREELKEKGKSSVVGFNARIVSIGFHPSSCAFSRKGRRDFLGVGQPFFMPKNFVASGVQRGKGRNQWYDTYICIVMAWDSLIWAIPGSYNSIQTGKEK